MERSQAGRSASSKFIAGAQTILTMDINDARLLEGSLTGVLDDIDGAPRASVVRRCAP